MYNGKTVSVVFATYREKNSIQRVLKDFAKTKFADELLVVNNNAQKGTDEEIKKSKTKTRIIHEENQGYGYAFQRALKEAKSDLIIVCEPDGSFLGEDLERFLVYSKSFEVVLGSRTSLIPSLSVAGMGFFRKFSNVIEAKTIEILFNTNALTDVGCAYKLFSRKSLKKLIPLWGFETSPLFNTQLILLIASEKIPFVEIPVTYLKRVGPSAIVDSWIKGAKWGVIIQAYILYFWGKYAIKKML